MSIKISIITVVRNNRRTINDAINSVLSQNYRKLEYVIVDGASSDGTVEVVEEAIRVNSAKDIKFISEKDYGIYDAMNKGILLASGDIIGTLNSDDYYLNRNVVSDIADEFVTKNVDSTFADLVYVRTDDLDKIVRYYSSADFHPKKMAYGWMPAHPTFFVKKRLYDQYGAYKTDYQISADYELIARFLVKNKASYSYIPKVLVKMRIGGASTRSLKNSWILNKEVLRACSENGIKTNIIKLLSKYPAKILHSFKRPK